MPTIKDIAERAGVSHGTVSNVLNKRGNVSVEKINLVEQTAKELGYYMNAQAKQLRAGYSQKICLVMPDINKKRYCDIYTGMNSVIRNSDYELDIFFTDDQNYEEERVLERIITLKPMAIVIISSFLKNNNIFNGETPFIFVERNVKNSPDNSVYFGLDYHLIGQHMAQQCVKDQKKKIAIYSECEHFSNNRAFQDGVKEVLENNSIEYQVFQSIDILKLNSGFELAHTDDSFDAIITDSEESAEILRSIFDFLRNDQNPDIYTLTNKGIHLDGSFKRYEVNYKLYGKKIAEYLLEIKKSETATSVELNYDGFEVPIFESMIQEEKKLNFLTLASPTTQALRYLLPDFKRKTGIEIKIVEMGYDELHKVLSKIEESNKNYYDLIRFDMVWLNQYGDKIFRPLQIEREPYKSIVKDFSKVFKDEYFLVKDTAYVLPMDPSVQILYYRKDLFENALIRRAFYEKYKRHLKTPKTFKEYDEIAEFFTREFNPNSPTKYGISISYGTEAVAACDFLPRLKEQGGFELKEDGSLNIHTEKMKTILTEYMHSISYSDRNMYQWWSQSIESFAKGETAMNIVFSNHASSMVLKNHSDIAGKVGFAAVPGGKPLLGGGVIGISKDTNEEAACELFLKWMYSEKIATQITMLGGYINHKSLVYNQDILQVYPWIEGMEKAFSIGTRKTEVAGVTSSKESLFEEVLGEAIRSSVLGLQTIDEALKEAEEKAQQLVEQ